MKLNKSNDLLYINRKEVNKYIYKISVENS